MMPSPSNAVPAEVLDTCNLFRSWRATRKPGSPMPSELWMAAVRLARVHGLTTISRSLPIDYGALKRRMEAAEGVQAPRFIELNAMPAAKEAVIEGPVVELTDASGAKMTLRLAAGASVDVAELVSAFWRRSP